MSKPNDMKTISRQMRESDFDEWADAYDKLVEVATRACSEMGCHCTAPHEQLTVGQLSPLCELGELLHSQSTKAPQ